MKLMDYYEKLRDRFGAIADFQAFPVPLEEIAEALDCTTEIRRSSCSECRPSISLTGNPEEAAGINRSSNFSWQDKSLLSARFTS